MEEKIKVIIVDDSALVRKIITDVLENDPMIEVVGTANNGKTAVFKNQTLNPDVITMDIEMPIMNGLDFISRVRMLPGEARYLPIIMLTGHSDLPRLNAARDRGVNEFLAKPVTARDILKRLESVIMRPRPYVAASDFFGPDRRRRSPLGYAGPMRRAADNAGVLEL